MDETPIWRTRLWPFLIAWMGLIAATPFAVWPMAEAASPSPVIAGLVVLLGVGPVLLLLWSLVVMMREPVTGWIAPTMLLAFCGGLIPAAMPMLEAGQRLNFDAHRPVYEALVTQARDGRLGGQPLANGWVEGERDTVRYRYPAGRAGEMEFVWVTTRWWENGVRYDDTPCHPQPGLRCVDQGRPLDGFYSYYETRLL
jgi:hypothetical protein